MNKVLIWAFLTVCSATASLSVLWMIGVSLYALITWQPEMLSLSFYAKWTAVTAVAVLICWLGFGLLLWLYDITPDEPIYSHVE
jgi:hypothetical protein